MSENDINETSGFENVADLGVHPLEKARARADELGCFMQLFVAFNPESGAFMLASNDPDTANNQSSAELETLVALLVEYVAEAKTKPTPPQAMH